MDDAQFTLSQVAAAAGVSAHTLRSWLQRGHWQLDKLDNRAHVAGAAHLVTLRRALHIGAAVEFIHNDMEPARAFVMARSFVDIFHDDTRGEDGLFATGWTLLVAYPGIPFGVVKHATKDTSLESILSPPLGPYEHSGVFIWLNQVDRRIRTRLLPREA